MDSERHKRVSDLFHRAANLHESEREAFLRRESGGDNSLVAEVLGLLAHDPGSVGPIRTEGASSLVGVTIGPYSLLETLGSGGMGVVYRARDLHLERDVAIKVLPAGTLADPAARTRFRNEALALSRLYHPAIATVFDFDTQNGTDFLVMEYALAEKDGWLSGHIKVDARLDPLRGGPRFERILRTLNLAG